MFYGFRIVLVSLALVMGIVPVTQAQRGSLAEQVNRGTVGIISGGVNGTYIRIAADLSAVLDKDDLRVLSIIGKGSVQNVTDLLYLKGIDIAIVQSDVLEFMRRQNIYRNIDKKIDYIAKLYNEEFHILAKNTVSSLTDLAGKKVNFDGEKSGTAMTASIVFNTLDIAVEPTYYDQASALEKLRNDEIAALVYVAGKPAQLFQNIGNDEGLRFLTIDYTPALLETYLPTSLNNQDYPNLIPPGQEVNTLAVGAVMAVYHWTPENPRYKKVARFINEYFEHFDDFLQPSRHPKWKEINLNAMVPGWTRFEVAKTWVERNAKP